MIQVLTNTTTNWELFNEYILKTLSKNPKKIISEHNLNSTNPYSLPVSLQLLRDPNFSPWKGNLDLDLLQHIFLSLILDVSKSILVKFSQLIFLKTSILEINQDKIILILSGTVLDWKNSVPINLQKDTDLEVRRIFSAIYSKFRQTDFRNLWNEFDVSKDSEGVLFMELHR
jgi:hypothetical protein